MTVEAVERIAFDGEQLNLHADVLRPVEAAHRQMTATLGNAPVYGVNTGAGYLAGRVLSGEQQREHQRNLLLGRAVGGPPFLDRGEARALLAVRIAGFLSARTGVSEELVRFLADRLADDFVPAIPRRGIGCAGEVISSAHAFQTLLGVGHVLDDAGRPVDAAAALAEHAVAPYEPAPKEGIALLAGAPGALALAITHRRRCSVLADQLHAAVACAIDALRAPLSPYGPQLDELSQDTVLAGVLERLRGLLAGSAADRAGTQAPVSYRVAPRLIAQLVRTLGRLKEDCERALRGVDDSPAFVDGEFVTTGGFHPVELSTALDHLGVVLTQAAELVAQLTHRLLDSRFTGLPDQLTPEPGPRSGLIVVHKRAAGAVNELRRLAAPASVGLVDTSLGQEDAMTFAFEAAEKLRRMEELVREVLACGLLTARQAWALRAAGDPDTSERPPYATGLTRVAEALCQQVDPVDADRPLGGDVERLAALLAAGELRGMAPS